MKRKALRAITLQTNEKNPAAAGFFNNIASAEQRKTMLRTIVEIIKPEIINMDLT